MKTIRLMAIGFFLATLLVTGSASTQVTEPVGAESLSVRWHRGRQSAVPNPANGWEPAASMPTGRLDLATVTGTDGRIYAIGGYNPYAGGYLGTVEAYDTTTDSWTTVPSMPTPRWQLAAAVGSDGRIYAMGGENGTGGLLDTVEAYDPSTNTWAGAASMPTARASLAAATGSDGRIYAIGGLRPTESGGVYANTVEAYNPTTNAWESLASMPTARRYLAAARGTDGRVYAIGGWDNNSLGTVEAYTPATNSWATVASLPTPRARLAAASGPDGRIYIVGGYNGVELATLEAYAVGVDAWSTAPSMPTARFSLGATTGPNGRVYAVGGAAGGVALSTVESYPSPDTPPSVGGIAALPDVAESDSSVRNFIALAALSAAAFLALTAGGWYARRRWVR